MFLFILQNACYLFHIKVHNIWSILPQSKHSRDKWNDLNSPEQPTGPDNTIGFTLVISQEDINILFYTLLISLIWYRWVKKKVSAKQDDVYIIRNCFSRKI